MKNELVDLLADLLEMREEATEQHKGGNSDMVYYEGAGKLKVIDKVLPVLRKLVKTKKG